MIKDVFTLLKADSALLTLLGGTSTASHIFPENAPEDQTEPYIVLRHSTDGGNDENIKDQTIQVSIFAKDYDVLRNIDYRVKTLLDKEDQISMPSSEYNVYYCKHTGGSGMYEADTGLFHKVLLFGLRYNRKA